MSQSLAMRIGTTLPTPALPRLMKRCMLSYAGKALWTTPEHILQPSLRQCHPLMIARADDAYSLHSTASIERDKNRIANVRALQAKANDALGIPWKKLAAT